MTEEQRAESGPSGPTGTVVSRDGTTIAYDRYGSGDPVVVVGGSLSSRASLAPVARALGSQFTVFSYDRRGRGDSGDTAPYAVEREIEDLAAMVAEAGGTACVLGHSSGAALVIRAAAAGLPISRLALYEPPFILDGAHATLGAEFIARQNELIAAGKRGEALEYFLVNTVGLPEEGLEEMRQMPFYAALAAIVHTTVYDAMIMQAGEDGTPMPPEWAETVKQPVLVMVGGESGEWIHDSARALAGLLPAARVQTFPGADHDIPPEPLLPVLREFCAGA